MIANKSRISVSGFRSMKKNKRVIIKTNNPTKMADKRNATLKFLILKTGIIWRVEQIYNPRL